MKNLDSDTSFKLLSKPNVINIPMPMDTAMTSMALGRPPFVARSTCWAKMCRSGSATEIIKPSTKPASKIVMSLPFRAIKMPNLSPISETARSIPARKITKPIKINRLPKRKRKIKGVSIGVKLKCSNTPMIVIGRIEGKTSLNLETNIFNFCHPF